MKHLIRVLVGGLYFVAVCAYARSPYVADYKKYDDSKLLKEHKDVSPFIAHPNKNPEGSKKAEDAEDASNLAESYVPSKSVGNPEEFAITKKDRLSPKGGYTSSREQAEENAGKSAGEILGELAKLNSKSFGFAIAKDNSIYINNKNNFNQIFKKQGADNFSLALLLNFDRKISVTALGELYWTLLTGLFYNEGRGIFQAGTVKKDGNTQQRDEEISKTRIILYRTPLELFLMYQVNLADIIKLYARGGPGLCFLMQFRSDYPDRKKGKYVYQIGAGVSGDVGIKFNLSRLFVDHTMRLFGSNSITSIHLNISARYQNYPYFLKKELTIEGLSYGAGLVFDFR